VQPDFDAENPPERDLRSQTRPISIIAGLTIRDFAHQNRNALRETRKDAVTGSVRIVGAQLRNLAKAAGTRRRTKNPFFRTSNAP
jgi:hypothetical protein